MQSIKQELSPYNQIYFSKQVFVNTNNYSNIFIFTFEKRHIFTEISHRIFSIIYLVDPPPSSFIECQKFAKYNCICLNICK
eukprot:UN25257